MDSTTDMDEESKFEHLVAVSQAEIVDWRHALIDYLCYNILPEDPRKGLKFVVVLLGFFTTKILYIEDHSRESSCVVWGKKKRFKLCKKHILEFVDHINLGPSYTFI
uniref:Putative ovule protein n=1 Tax=Solanum chacoense TaxID=4108 RepID=A0A0V0GY80_SOLCH